MHVVMSLNYLLLSVGLLECCTARGDVQTYASEKIAQPVMASKLQNQSDIQEVIRSTVPFADNAVANNASTIGSTSPHPSGKRPPVNQQQLSQCGLIPVNYANASLGRMLLPTTEYQLDQLFHRETSDRYQRTEYKQDRSPLASQRAVSSVVYRDCYFLFIYSTQCRFSLAALPSVRALARAYPQFRMVGVSALDYLRHRWSLRMFFVPKLKFIVDGRIIREYAGLDDCLDDMINFVWLNTQQMPKGPVGLIPADHTDLPSTPTSTPDYFLFLSWILTILGCSYLVGTFCTAGSEFLPDLLYRVSCGWLGKQASDVVLDGTIVNRHPEEIAHVHGD